MESNYPIYVHWDRAFIGGNLDGITIPDRLGFTNIESARRFADEIKEGKWPEYSNPQIRP